MAEWVSLQFLYTNAQIRPWSGPPEKKLESFLMQFVLFRGLHVLFCHRNWNLKSSRLFLFLLLSWPRIGFVESLPMRQFKALKFTQMLWSSKLQMLSSLLGLFPTIFRFSYKHLEDKFPNLWSPETVLLVPLIPISVVFWCVFLFFSSGLVTLADSLVLFSREKCLRESSPCSPVCTSYSVMHTWYYYYFRFSVWLSFHDRGNPRREQK